MRIFLFTNNDEPHSKDIDVENHKQAIIQAKKLNEIDVQIELFPLQKPGSPRFDITKF